MGVGGYGYPFEVTLSFLSLWFLSILSLPFLFFLSLPISPTWNIGKVVKQSGSYGVYHSFGFHLIRPKIVVYKASLLRDLRWFTISGLV